MIISATSLKRTTDASDEIVDLYEAKDHLNVVDDTDDDEYLTALIKTVRHTIEDETGRALAAGQEWTACYKCFGCFEIPKPPLLSVVSVVYYDDQNTLGTVSTTEYIIDDSGDEYAYLTFTGDFSPPVLSSDYRGPVRVNFTAGYTVETLPLNLKQAMLYLIAHFYTNRVPVSVAASVAEMPMTFKYLLNQKKVWNSF